MLFVRPAGQIHGRDAKA